MSDTELAAAVTPPTAAASKSGGVRHRPAALRPATKRIPLPTLAEVCAVGSVLATASVAVTLAHVVAWTTQQFTVSDEVAASTSAYTALAVLAAAVAIGVSAGRRLRYYRQERRAERARWEKAQPGFRAALAAKRAEPAKTPKPALPRGLGLPIS